MRSSGCAGTTSTSNRPTPGWSSTAPCSTSPAPAWSGSPPKTRNSRRTILLNPPHVEALRAVKAQQAAARLAADWDFNPDGYVFVTRRGTPVDPNNDSKGWHALLDAAGVRRVRRHDARHTAATLLLEAGAGLANVQRMLGHSTISTTVDVYGHLDAADSVAYTATHHPTARVVHRVSRPRPFSP